MRTAGGGWWGGVDSRCPLQTETQDKLLTLYTKPHVTRQLSHMETRSKGGGGGGVNCSDLSEALCTGPACTLRLEEVVVVGVTAHVRLLYRKKTVREHSGGAETSLKVRGGRAGEHFRMTVTRRVGGGREGWRLFTRHHETNTSTRQGRTKRGAGALCTEGNGGGGGSVLRVTLGIVRSLRLRS